MSELYQYEGCGLPYVFLRNGYELVETPYGKGVTIHDLVGLHKAIAEQIVCSPDPLIGCEFRFLRTELELSQESLAGLLGRDVQSVARWEKGKNKRIDPSAERILRIVYRETMMDGTQKLKPVIELLRKLESKKPEPRQFVARERNDNWEATTKAVAVG